MSSKKRKARPTSTTLRVFICPNPLCLKTFTKPQGLTNHFLHYSACNELNVAGLNALAGKVAGQSAFSDPCVDSDGDDMTAPSGRFDFVAEYPDNADASVVSTIAAQQVAVANGAFTNVAVVSRQAGVCHTNDDRAEVELLKILEDANTPHYLFKDIMNWAAMPNKISIRSNPNARLVQLTSHIWKVILGFNRSDRSKSRFSFPKTT